MSASAKARVTPAVGMAVFLGALAMMFAAMLLAYAIVRSQAASWPPPGTPRLPVLALGVNTLVLLASSLALRAGDKANRRQATGDGRQVTGDAGSGNGAAGRLWVIGALVLGAGFLGAQAVIWRGLVARGLGPASGIYGSVFFALSGLHAMHVLGGLAAIGAALARGKGLRLVAGYWDFVLVVWIVFYAAAFVA